MKNLKMWEILGVIAGVLVLNKVMKAKVAVVAANNPVFDTGVVPGPVVAPAFVNTAAVIDSGVSTAMKSGVGYNSGFVFNADGTHSVITANGDTVPVVQQTVQSLPTASAITVSPTPIGYESAPPSVVNNYYDTTENHHPRDLPYTGNYFEQQY